MKFYYSIVDNNEQFGTNLLATLLLYATPTPHWLFLTIAISPAQLVPWLLGSLDEYSGEGS